MDLVPVTTFQPSLATTASSYLCLVTSSLDLRATFSICLWTRLAFINGPGMGSSSVLSVANGDRDNALFLGKWLSFWKTCIFELVFF